MQTLAFLREFSRLRSEAVSKNNERVFCSTEKDCLISVWPVFTNEYTWDKCSCVHDCVFLRNRTLKWHISHKVTFVTCVERIPLSKSCRWRVCRSGENFPLQRWLSPPRGKKVFQGLFRFVRLISGLPKMEKKGRSKVDMCSLKTMALSALKLLQIFKQEKVIKYSKHIYPISLGRKTRNVPSEKN